MTEWPKEMHLDSNVSKSTPSSHTISKKREARRDDASALGVDVSFIFTGFSFLVSISQNKDSGEPFRVHFSDFSAGLKPALQIGGANAPNPQNLYAVLPPS
jgi:hypothetical protein